MNSASHETHPSTDELEPNFEYQLLVGHSRTDGSIKSDEQLRSEYIQRTDELIRKITEGVDTVDPATGETERKNFDYVVWLDKSARPVSWLTKEFWPKLAAEPGKDIPPMPQFRYVNIDREQWVNTVDPEGKGLVNVDLVDKSIVRSLRSIFLKPQHKQQGLTEEIDTAPAELDGKNVLIVDEVFSSGRTLQIAEKFFERAFPDSNISGSYWMAGVAQKGLAVGNADLPVWYKEKDSTGRGVDNRDERRSQLSPSLTQRLGGWFLSTAFKSTDENSAQLRDEIKHMAHDPNVLIVPSNQREEEEYDVRATELNHLSIKEFADVKKSLGHGKV
jgi:hypothetical protein